MKSMRVTLVATFLAAATLAAYAAAPLSSAFGPPTSEQLGLSGGYALQWNDLRRQTLELRDATRHTMQQEIEKLQGLLGAPAPDLDAFNAEAERLADSHLAQARALRAKKLALYDSLPAAQQAQVRSVLAERVARLQHLRAALSELDAATP